MVQKHSASHLHYDFRLEIGGVLKSWAVPKGPPKLLSEKRLAVETEDHPMEYAKFEGRIPEGHYGAGTVMIWDHGYYYNLKDSGSKPSSIKKSYEDGHLEIELVGQKLQGKYALIRTKMGEGKKEGKNWLFIKMKSHE